MRRSAQGRLSELFGQKTVVLDEFVRRLDLYNLARTSVKHQSEQTINILKAYYKNDFFIKIYKPNTQIGTGSVIETNNCDISVCQTRLKNKIVIFSSIDNLIKGAAGQAIQNMNILYNFRETSGLK